jgi:hypothetical protein
MLTFDRSGLTLDAQGNARGVPFGATYTTHDGRTVDSTGAFLIGELERLDQTLHEPLVTTSWGRDVDLREDVTIADEVSSFLLSTYASAGGLGTGQGIGNGKAWIGKNTDQITGVSVDLAKVPQPLHPWAIELKYTILELESSARVGRPIDQQKYNALVMKHDMDVDEQVYIGDLSMTDTGLVNKTGVAATNVAASAQAGNPTKWISAKTPVEILSDLNTAIVSTWTASGYKFMPNRVLIPPAHFGYLSSTLISTAGNQSIMKYLLENNILAASGQGRLEIFPMKWLIGAGAGGVIGQTGTVDRMVVYTKDPGLVRYPMTLLQRTPVQYESIYHKTTYFCKLGVLEVVYPETMGYFDMI